MSRAIYKRCEALADSLDLPRPFAMRTLLASVSARRGRPLEVVTAPIPPSDGHGLYVAVDTVDIIFVSQFLPPIPRRQVSLHEIGHVLFQGTDLGGDDEPDDKALDALLLLLPGLDAGAVRRVLGRSNYSTRPERAAETFASVASTRIQAIPETAWDPSPEVARLIGTFEDGRHG